jgi:phenylalanine ammonia-lyase
LYEAARIAAGEEPRGDRTLVWDDMDGFLQPKIEGILSSIADRGPVMDSVAGLVDAIRDFAS